jgi:hypothetical protein
LSEKSHRSRRLLRISWVVFISGAALVLAIMITALVTNSLPGPLLGIIVLAAVSIGLILRHRADPVFDYKDDEE